MRLATSLLLLLTVFAAVAQAQVPAGHFQVEPASWTRLQATDKLPLSGLVHVEAEFPTTKFILETPIGSFSSTEVKGSPGHFEVKGILVTTDGERELTLLGEYFGTITKEDGVQKILMKLSSAEVIFSLYASRPNGSTTSLHKIVQEINQ